MLLYGGQLSLFSRKVEIALREKGLAYEAVMVPFTQTGGYAPMDPVVLAANPKRQVPVLIDGELTLYDSTVILEYLEDAYPTPPLYPAGARDRARCRQWELFADEVMLEPVRRLFHRTEPHAPDDARWLAAEAATPAAEAAILAHFAALEHQLGAAEYMCDAFSVADIAVFMVMLHAERNGGPTAEDHPRLAAWQGRLRRRPAFAAIVAEVAEADRALSAPVQRRAARRD
jgi:glutathione S-transferase